MYVNVGAGFIPACRKMQAGTCPRPGGPAGPPIDCPSSELRITGGVKPLPYDSPYTISPSLETASKGCPYETRIWHRDAGAGIPGRVDSRPKRTY